MFLSTFIDIVSNCVLTSLTLCTCVVLLVILNNNISYKFFKEGSSFS